MKSQNKEVKDVQRDEKMSKMGTNLKECVDSGMINIEPRKTLTTDEPDKLDW